MKVPGLFPGTFLDILWMVLRNEDAETRPGSYSAF